MSSLPAQDVDEMEAVSSRAGVLRAMEQCLSQRTTLMLYTNELNIGNNTIMLIVDPGSDRLLLDRVRNQKLEQRILKAGKTSVFTSMDGMLYAFEVEALELVQEGEDTYYAARIPRRIYRRQRRKYYRAMLADDIEGVLHFPLRSGIKSGNIADISLGGVGALLPGDHCEALREQRLFEETTIAVGKDLEFETDLEMRFCAFVKESKATKVGFRITRTQPMEERKLARLILHLDKLRLKH